MDVNQTSELHGAQTLVKCHMNGGSAVGLTLRFWKCVLLPRLKHNIDSKEVLDLSLDTFKLCPSNLISYKVYLSSLLAKKTAVSYISASARAGFQQQT